MFKFFKMLYAFNFLKLGVGEGAAEEATVKAVVNAVEKALPEVVSEVAKQQFAQLSEKAFAEINDIKTELKKYSLAQKQAPELKTLFTQAAMVSIVKRVWNENVTTEKAFQSIVEAEMKTMSEGIAGDGAELVFDQFEKDILRVINEYGVVNSVKILTIQKWDKINLPKATNGVSTVYVKEANAATASDADTWFVSIDIYKAVSLVDMTDELLDDTMTTPDLYNLIVEFIWESQAEFLENEIINGSGTDAIEGILNNNDILEVVLAVTETGEDITDDEITAVITKSAMKFKRRSSLVKWLMSQYTYGLLRKIKTADGYPLYPELRNMANPYLEGYKVEISDKMPVQNSTQDIAGAVQLIFGDLTYFTLVKRKNLMLERGYYGSNWKSGIQSLKGTARFGWKATFGAAFTVLKNGAAS